ncbi:MAG: twin-arginine translocation signal domain-containing protein [Pseudomonadota bacterium]
MKSPQSKLSRRNFLFAAGAGSVAATAALLAAKGGDQPAGKPEKTVGSQGYRLTEHIRNYYRTTKV